MYYHCGCVLASLFIEYADMRLMQEIKSIKVGDKIESGDRRLFARKRDKERKLCSLYAGQ